MATTYHAGRRIQTTSTEFGCNGAGIPGVTGGWKELARTTLGSASSTITVSSLADKRYYMVLVDGQPNSTGDKFYRLGNGSVDSGTNYARRFSADGGADGTGTSQDKVVVTPGGASNLPNFDVSYISNLSGNEKLVITNNMSQQTAGSGTAPSRRENVWKWANTSNPLDVVSFQSTGTNAYASGSEVVVLGYDPDDTHADNFWEELADITLGSDASEISSGTITAKKYLWVQVYFQNASNSDDVLVRFNNDTGSNYAHRHAINYGSDTTQTSGSSIKLIDRNGAADTGRFVNFFAINNSSNKKLLIAHGMEEETSGAGNPPTSNECVAKWANTSSQITEIDCFTNSGNIRSGARLKVWGSN